MISDAWCPSASLSQTRRGPLRLEMNASCLPSGDQAGMNPAPSRTTSPPSGESFTICATDYPALEPRPGSCRQARERASRVSRCQAEEVLRPQRHCEGRAATGSSASIPACRAGGSRLATRCTAVRIGRNDEDRQAREQHAHILGNRACQPHAQQFVRLITLAQQVKRIGGRRRTECGEPQRVIVDLPLVAPLRRRTDDAESTVGGRTSGARPGRGRASTRYRGPARCSGPRSPGPGLL